MQDTFKALKDKYSHLEFSIVNFKETSKHLIFGSDFNSGKRINALSTLTSKSNKTLIDFFDLINTSISSIAEPTYIYDLTHSLGNFLADVEIANENLGSNKKEAIAGDFIISRLRSYLQEMAVVGQKDFRQLFSSEYLVYRPKTNILSSNTLMAFVLTKTVQMILNHSQYGTEHPRFYEFVLNGMPIPQILIELNTEIELIMKKAYHKLEQSKSLYKEAENLLYESLAMPKSACSEGNSSLGNHCVDLANFECSQTPSLASHSKFAKNSTSTSASRRLDERSEVPNTRILGESQGDSADSMESSENNSVIASETKQSINEINPHEVPPNLAPLRGAKKEEQGGSSASALLELEADKARLSPKSETAAAVWRVGERGGGAALFAKKSDHANETNLKESRRRERAESTAELESLTFSSDSSTLQNAQPKATQTHTTEALRLKFPHLNFSIKPLSLSLQKSGRLDSEYYQSKYENIEALIKSYKGGFCRLKDIGFFTNGSFVPESLYTQKAKRAYIRIKELSFNAPINLQDCIYIDDSFKASNETIVRQNDFVIATIGTIGKVNLIPKELDGSFISNNTSRFRLNNTSIMPEFLELLLRNLIVQEQIQKEFTQTVQAKISNNSLENILIPLLDSQIQEQIASKLKLSFALKKEAKELLNLAKSKVESAIEGKIS